MSRTEERLDEIDREIEDIKERLDKIEDSSSDEVEEDEENRTLYVYILFVYGTSTGLFGQIDRQKVLVEKAENDTYTVPNEPVAEQASTVRQVINILGSRGIDAWDNIERIAEKEDAVYFEAEIPEEAVKCADCDYWIDKRKAERIITTWEAKEYL